MRQVECVNCGETVTIADRGEQIIDGETPLEHIERTGHPHVREPRALVCDDCGYLWMYGGAAERPTCPNCRGKRVRVPSP